MATQASNTSQRDDAMTAGGPGADSQSPPSQGAPASSTTGGSGETTDRSASDPEHNPASANQASAADSNQPANAGASSPSSSDQSASPSGNGAASTSAANNSDGAAGPADSGNSANVANGDGSAGSGTSSDSASAENQGGSTGTGDAAADSGSSDGSSLHLAGSGAPLQPIFDAVNGVASDVTGSSGILQGVVDAIDTAGIGAIGATPSADGHGNLITDLVNFPGDAVSGDLNGSLSHIFADLSDTADATTGVIGDLLGGHTVGLVSNAAAGANDLLHPATDLIGSAGNDLQSDSLVSLNGDGLVAGSVGLPGGSSGDAVQVNTSLVGTSSPNGLLTINGGNNAGDGGVTGATIGDLNGSSSGNLINVDAGPQSDHTASVGVLTARPDSGNTASVGAVDVGPNGPQLADAGVLTDPGTFNIANLNGAGTDSLAGNVINVSTGETGASVLQPTPVAANAGEVQDVPAVPVTQDHGILDVNHTHII